MKIPTLLAIAALFAASLSAQDAVFESSDGLWTDSTVEKKGRDFQTILWTFESYRMKNNKPDVSLVRITPKPKKSFLKKRIPEEDIKWKVPLGESSGKAKHPIPSYTEEERLEISRRAKLAYQYWQNKQY